MDERMLALQKDKTADIDTVLKNGKPAMHIDKRILSQLLNRELGDADLDGLDDEPVNPSDDVQTDDDQDYYIDDDEDELFVEQDHDEDEADDDYVE